MTSPGPSWAIMPDPPSTNASENEDDETEEAKPRSKPKPKRRATDGGASRQPKKKPRMENESRIPINRATLGPPSRINIPRPATAQSTSTLRKQSVAGPGPTTEESVAAELNNAFSASTVPMKRTKMERLKRDHVTKPGISQDMAIVVSSSDDDKALKPTAGKIPGAGLPSRPPLPSAASAPLRTRPPPEVIEITDSEDEQPRKPSAKPVPRPSSSSSHSPEKSRSVLNSALAGDYEDLAVDGQGRESTMDMGLDERMDIDLPPPSISQLMTSTSVTAPVKIEKKQSSSRTPDSTIVTAPGVASTSNSIFTSTKPGAVASASSGPKHKHKSREAQTISKKHPAPTVISSDSDEFDLKQTQKQQQPTTATEPRFTHISVAPSSSPTTAGPSKRKGLDIEAKQKQKPRKSSKGKEKIRADESEPEDDTQWIDSLRNAFNTSGEANSNLTSGTKVGIGVVKGMKKPVPSASMKPVSSASVASYSKAFETAANANLDAVGSTVTKKPSSLKPRSSASSSDSSAGSRSGGSGALIPPPHSRKQHTKPVSSASVSGSSAQSHPKPLSSSRVSLGSSNPLVQKDLGQRIKPMKSDSFSSISSKPTLPKSKVPDREKGSSEEEREWAHGFSNFQAALLDYKSQLGLGLGRSVTTKEERESTRKEIDLSAGLSAPAGPSSHPSTSASSRQPVHLSDPQDAERMIDGMNDGGQALELERRDQEAPEKEKSSGASAETNVVNIGARDEAEGGNAASDPGEDVQNDGIRLESDGLPPLDYVDIPDHILDARAKDEDEGKDVNDEAMQIDLEAAGFVPGDRQMDGNDSDSDSEMHVEHMVDVRNEPDSPPPSIPSDRTRRAVVSVEPMVEVPVTVAELSGRSIPSRSPSSQASAADLVIRRSSRNRQSRRASSSYSSTGSNEYEFALLGNYDSSASSDANDTPPRSTTPEDEKKNLSVPPSSYGGLPVVTWAHKRALLRHEPPPYKLSKDLSHVMHDYINSYNAETRNHPEMQRVYQWMIEENTSLDEPDAPKIKIINETETAATEPTPPWEFVYTNEMWLGDNVSPPSRENLVACDCEGKCTKSTCKCWQKQEGHTASYEVKGFIYDQNGLMKMVGLPVFECNSLCNCGDECRNRVVSQGRKCKVVIKKTQKKGWGVFAAERIPKGMFIGIYSGELLGHEESEERAIKYDEFGRTYLFDIDWWYITAELEAKEAQQKEEEARAMGHRQVETSDATPPAPSVKQGDDDEDDSDSDAGGEKRRPSKYTVDAYHAGNFTRFLNHSCDPNAALTPVYIDEADIERPLLTIFAKRDIKINEEITFSYSGDPDADSDNEEVLPQPHTPKRGKNGRNARKPMDTPKRGRKGDARVHVDCECGSKRCKGTIWRE